MDLIPDVTPGTRLRGIVRKVLDGFGFITVTGHRDHYIHKTEIEAPWTFSDLSVGTLVEFESQPDPTQGTKPRSSPRACKLTVVVELDDRTITHAPTFTRPPTKGHAHGTSRSQTQHEHLR